MSTVNVTLINTFDKREHNTSMLHQRIAHAPVNNKYSIIQLNETKYNRQSIID